MAITSGGIIIRMPVAGISEIGRNTQGVRVMRLDKGNKLVSIAKVVSEDEEPEEVPEVGSQNESPSTGASDPMETGEPLETPGSEIKDEEDASIEEQIEESPKEPTETLDELT